MAKVELIKRLVQLAMRLLAAIGIRGGASMKQGYILLFLAAALAVAIAIIFFGPRLNCSGCGSGGGGKGEKQSVSHKPPNKKTSSATKACPTIVVTENKIMFGDRQVTVEELARLVGHTTCVGSYTLVPRASALFPTVQAVERVLKQKRVEFSLKETYK